MEWEEIEYAAIGAMVGVELGAQYKNWMAAQWMALPEEKREEWREWAKGEKEDADAEEPATLMAYLGF